MGHWHVENEDLLRKGFELVNDAGHACLGDLELLIHALKDSKESPVVVQLGAGSGTMAHAVLAVRPKARLISVDISGESIERERYQLELSGFKNGNRSSIIGDSTEIGHNYSGPKIDLLIIDADHSGEAVLSDLIAWYKHVKKSGYIFIHDYDGRFAPLDYSGVAIVCLDFFKRAYLWKNGWSAVWVKK